MSHWQARLGGVQFPLPMRSNSHADFESMLQQLFLLTLACSGGPHCPAFVFRAIVATGRQAKQHTVHSTAE